MRPSASHDATLPATLSRLHCMHRPVRLTMALRQSHADTALARASRMAALLHSTHAPDPEHGGICFNLLPDWLAGSWSNCSQTCRART
jgi:hypothetical protein